MNNEQLTPASLTAFLTVKTVVPMLLGKLENKPPVVGIPLTPEQRSNLGLPEGGSSLVYDVDASHVLMDLSGNRAMISFTNGDADVAIGTLDRFLKRDLPQLRQVEDSEHPRGGARRLRVYSGDLDPAMLCQIEADYPPVGVVAAEKKFVARVSAFVRK